MKKIFFKLALMTFILLSFNIVAMASSDNICPTAQEMTIFPYVELSDSSPSILLNPILDSEDNEGGKCGDNMTWSYNAESKELFIDGSGNMWNYPTDHIVNYYWYDNGVIPFITESEYCEDDFDAPEYIVEYVGSTGQPVFIELGRPCELIYCDSSGGGKWVVVYTDRPSEIRWFYNDDYAEPLVIYTDEPSVVEWFSNGRISVPCVLYDKYSYEIRWYYADGEAHCIPAPFAPWVNLDIEKIVLSESVTDVCMGAVGGYCFEVCEGNTSFYVDGNGALFTKDKKTLISYPANSDNKSFTIPDSVEKIEDYAFTGCTSLTSVTVPKSVKSIDSSAFKNCTSLENITFEENSQLTNLGSSAFYSCINLKSITIPNGVTSIGDCTFENCENLKSISFERGSQLDSIGICAFIYCESLESITIPDGVDIIDYDMFEGCISLSSITIPDTVESIEDFAFYGCDNLSDVYYTGTEDEWNSIYIGAMNEALENATIHTEESSGIICGDMNEDGAVDVSDVIFMLQTIASGDDLSDAQEKAADFNGDGNVDVSDVISMLQYLASGI